MAQSLTEVLMTDHMAGHRTNTGVDIGNIPLFYTYCTRILTYFSYLLIRIPNNVDYEHYIDRKSPSLLFLVVGLMSILLLIGLISVTERASDDQRFVSLDDAVVVEKLPRDSNKTDCGSNYVVASVFLIP